jgi:dTDP-4-dehydrorhamnose reductase
MKEADPDVVLNCIAITPDSIRDTDVQSAILTNSVFPHYISGITKQWGGRLIHISTDGVFSGQRGGYTEFSPPDPRDLYGRSKLLGEVVDENCLTIRTSFYGPCAQGRGLVDWIISKRGEEINGYQNYVFSGLSMTTLGRAIVAVLDKEGGLEGLYHLGGPKLSKFELLKMLSEKLGLGVKVHAVSEPVIDISLDSTRFYNDTKMVFPTLDNMMLEIKEEAKSLGML